jgi:hypothetical protein
VAIPSVQVFLGEEATIDGTPTWVDVSSFVRLEHGLTVQRGSSFGAGAQPGTASFTLDNTDGRFTVGNVSSPLYPYVHLQSLVKMTRDGRPWFIGRIQSMPLSWPEGGDNDCLMTVTLADRLARFERMKLDSFPVEEIKSLAPAGYWPMDEPTGAAQADNAMSSPWPLMYYQPGDGTVAFAGSTGPAGDGRSSPTFTPGTVPPVLLSGSGPFQKTVPYQLTLSAAFATTTDGLIVRINTQGTVASGAPYGVFFDISVGTFPSGAGIRVVNGATAGDYGNTFSPCSVMDGATHVVTFVLDLTIMPQYVVYLDGVALSTSGSLIFNAAQYQSLTTTVQVGSGDPVNSGSSYVTAGFAGTISHVAAWPRPLSATEALQVATALRGKTLGTQAAMQTVLGWRGQAATALIDAGATDLIPSTSVGSGTLASTLYAISASEAGTLFVDSQDRLTWKNRRTLPSPSITLGPDDIDSGLNYNCDLTRLVTLVTGNRVKGGNVIVKSADYDTIGEISGSVSSLSTNPVDAADHASWVANTGPRGPYIGSLKIDMATATAAVNTAIDTAGILTKVTLTGMPTQTPPGGTILEVIGEAETITATTWDVTYTTLPAGLGSPRDVLTLDSATYGPLDSTHRIAY